MRLNQKKFYTGAYKYVVMAAKISKPTVPGTLRIGTDDLLVYEKTSDDWIVKVPAIEFPDAMHVIQLFKAHENFNALVDTKNPRFLKGQLSPEGKSQGARINILPDGRALDKAYSLFAEHLTIHDEASNEHWDVLYRNPGGTYSYVYTLEKRDNSVKKKYSEVEEFERCYPDLIKRVDSALSDYNDNMAVPMYTLLKTCMRVGNEIYYKAHGHKGLTTLKKSDISINGNNVTFNYLSKNGVPTVITEKFPDLYVARLRKALDSIDDSSFVFVNPRSGHPLLDTHFKEAFRRYCGRNFYPHIVRSFYATQKAEEFLKSHGSATKKDIREFFLSVSEKLGHKRFVKKEQAWKDNYTVTVHHYIQPQLVDKIKALVKP